MSEAINNNENNGSQSKNKTSNWLATLPYLIIGIIMSISCYFLDQARGAAFVIVPYVTLYLVLKELGVTRKTKPQLVYPIYVSFIAYAIAVEWYILNNPIAR
jgi:hypothetical protein